MIVLWATLFFSVSIMGVVSWIQSDQDEQIMRSNSFRARQLAESGLTIALSDQVEMPDPLLNQQFQNGFEGFFVTITSEGQYLNLNSILQSGDVTVLDRLFTEWGLTASELRVVTDSLLDWVDNDEIRRLDGAEESYYFEKGITGAPPNRPLESLEEIEIVQGMDLVAALKPDWKEYFTLWNSGKVDINSASAEVIVAATGATIEDAEELVDTRNGPDDIPYTEDDYKFEALLEVMQILNIPASDQALYQQIQSRLSLDDPIKHIAGTGYVGDFEVTLEVVVNRQSRNPQFIQWQES